MKKLRRDQEAALMIRRLMRANGLAGHIVMLKDHDPILATKLVEELESGKSRLYYEAHITVDAGTDFQEFLDLCERNSWRGSRFDQDEVDDYHGKWFASWRHEEYGVIAASLLNLLAIMQVNGLKVLRYKIEDTLLDSKHGDTL